MMDGMMLESVALWVASKPILRYIMKLAKGWKLEKIKARIYIKPELPQLTGRVHVGSPRHTYRMIIFPIYIDNDSQNPVSVRSVKCVFTYDGLMLQSLTWEDEDDFTSNGTRLDITRGNIENPLDCRIECRFSPFPYLLSLPSSNERWGIRGVIEFQCFYGRFKKEFESNDLRIGSSEEWDRYRKEYRDLYSSYFGEMPECLLTP